MQRRTRRASPSERHLELGHTPSCETSRGFSATPTLFLTPYSARATARTMGNTLAQPVESKTTERGAWWAASTMQGWRPTNEDAAHFGKSCVPIPIACGVRGRESPGHRPSRFCWQWHGTHSREKIISYQGEGESSKSTNFTVQVM